MANSNYDKQREKLQLRVDAANHTAAALTSVTGGGLLLGLEGLDYNATKNRLRHNIRKYKKHFSEDTKDIRKYTNEGRSLYNEYFDWARKQTPSNNPIGDLAQDFKRINFEGDLKLKGIELQGAKDLRDLHKKYLKQDIKDLRKLQQRGFLRSANKFPLIAGVGFLGAAGYHANKARNLRAELNQASVPKPLRQKTASSNLPDRLRYTHTIDTEVVPDDVVKKLNLLEAIKKHKKQLAYGTVASALAGGALYAAHKHRQAEKTAADNTDTQGGNFVVRNKVPLAIGAGLVGAGLLAYKGRKMFTSKKTPISNTINNATSVHPNNVAVNSMDDILRKQQDNLASAERAFSDTKVNVTKNMADRHAEAQKSIKETLDNIFDPREAAKQAERKKRTADMFDEMDRMLDELKHSRES